MVSIEMSQQEEKINCPSRFGEKTREDCRKCYYRKLDVCPIGTYFIKNEPGDRTLWEDHLITGVSIFCPKCGGEYFAFRGVNTLEGMQLDVSCVKCGYRENPYEMYKVGGRKQE